MSPSPPGWQPDPRGRHEYRYWDGTQWTDHVSDKGQMSSDPVADATPPTAAAATPAPPLTEVQPAAATPAPEPVIPGPTSESAAPGGVPPVTPDAGTTGVPPAGARPSPSTAQARATVDEALHGKSPEVASILSVVVPGSGHLYMGVDHAKRPLAFGLIAATIAYFVLSYFSFVLFVVGLVIWLGAAAFALTDLRGGVKGLENTTLPRRLVGLLMIAGGGLLVVSLLLPWYHVKISAGGFSGSGNASGFESFKAIDIILLVIGIVAIAAGAAALGIGPVSEGELPSWLPLAVAVAGAVALVLVAFRMIVDPAPSAGPSADVTIGRAPGILLALDAALVLVLANASVLRSAAKR